MDKKADVITLIIIKNIFFILVYTLTDTTVTLLPKGKYHVYFSFSTNQNSPVTILINHSDYC